MQQEIKQLQAEIAAMGRSSQDLFASVNKDSQNLVDFSLGNLNDRVKILEEQARNQGEKLRTIDKRWQQYQDDMKALQKNLSDIRTAMVTPSDSSSLDQLIKNMQVFITICVWSVMGFCAIFFGKTLK